MVKHEDLVVGNEYYVICREPYDDYIGYEKLQYVKYVPDSFESQHPNHVRRGGSHESWGFGGDSWGTLQAHEYVKLCDVFENEADAKQLCYNEVTLDIEYRIEERDRRFGNDNN